MNTVSPSIAPALRRLYFFRFAFAAVWAGLLIPNGSSLKAVTVALLVLYPLFDAAAAVIDIRGAKAAESARSLSINAGISLLAGIGLGIASASGIAAVLRVWGAWAIVSGIVQLVTALSRRALGGQWPMIISGGLSAVVGTTFILQAGGTNPKLSSVGGYALVGGLFFLGSALRLGRRSKKALAVES